MCTSRVAFGGMRWGRSYCHLGISFNLVSFHQVSIIVIIQRVCRFGCYFNGQKEEGEITVSDGKAETTKREKKEILLGVYLFERTCMDMGHRRALI